MAMSNRTQRAWKGQRGGTPEEGHDRPQSKLSSPFPQGAQQNAPSLREIIPPAACRRPHETSKKIARLWVKATSSRVVAALRPFVVTAHPLGNYEVIPRCGLPHHIGRA